MNYWTKYDKAYRADTYFDESKTVGPATLNVWLQMYRKIYRKCKD